MTQTALLDLDSAVYQATATLRAVWPDWSGDLLPLRPVSGLLPSVPFRVTRAPTPSVIKVWAPDLSDKAARQAARQRIVAEGMNNGLFRASKVLHFDPAGRALLMQDCGGQELETALETIDDPQAQTLVTQAGGWIAAHHALSLRHAPFRLIGHLRWLDRLVTMGENGKRDFADLPRFRREVVAMHDLFETARRRPTIKAVIHKDMNAGNLLVGSDGLLWGVDFENDQEDEPLRDLFALGVEICAFSRFGQDRGRALTALTSGYGPQRGDPAVRLFLQRTFALGLWARTPAHASYRQQARLVVAKWILKQDVPVL